MPDRPRLELDQDMSDEERLEALREHFVEITDVHEELSSQLETADDRRAELKREVDRTERENEALKTSSLYIATVEEVADEEQEAVVKQHGNNQEVLTDVSRRMADELQAGDRVAVNDSFSVQTILSGETDARAQAMEVDASPDVVYDDICGIE